MGSVMSAIPRRFNTGKDTLYPLHKRLGWAPGTVWTGVENLAHPQWDSIPRPSSGYIIWDIEKSLNKQRIKKFFTLRNR
jgi:hypothetical protein